MGSAFPLRGHKRTMWEGGHRVRGEKTSKRSNEPFVIVLTQVPAVIYSPKHLKWRGIWNRFA